MRIIEWLNRYGVKQMGIELGIIALCAVAGWVVSRPIVKALGV